MGNLKHLDLDLILARADDRFEARVVHSPAGDGQSAEFGPLFGDLEAENFELKIARGRARTRRVEAAPVAEAKRFGARMFDAVFSGDTRECLRRSQDYAREHHAALRIRLRLAGCPELANLPWEFLYDASEDSFLALSVTTPLIRYLQLPDPPRAIAVSLPLQVLVIRSEPADLPELQLEEEWAQVADSVQELTDSGAVAFTTLATPSLGELRRVLMRGEFHVLHYMGHGSFDEETGGVLYFTGQDRRAVAVTATDLGVILRDHTSMRMAVLNACEGARTDPSDPFAGVAETLVRRGVPTVVAMQFEFTDQAAVEFAPALYGALAAGLPVDAAVTEARKAVYAISPVEWATPVLYMRAEDARLFSLTEPAVSPAAYLSRDQQPPGPLVSQSPDLHSKSATPVTPAPLPADSPAGTASISIRRRAEWNSVARAFSVLVDGNVVGKIRSGQSEIYNVPAGTHRVQVKLDWYTSPEVTVTTAAAECVAFVCGPSVPDPEVKRSRAYLRDIKKALTEPGSYLELLRE
jgi:CHAT domain-containing protein